MFLNDILSATPVPSAFVGSGDQPMQSRTFDYEDGPIALQDPTQGLATQQWRAYIQGSGVFVEADNTPAFQILPNTANSITDISIAFNQNADLHYVFVDAEVCKLWFYNTLTSAFELKTIPEARTPKITLDDKRPSQSGRSDIILSYIKNDNKLYFRKQRERFEIEHLLHNGPFIALERLYMNEGLRLQWMVTKA